MSTRASYSSFFSRKAERELKEGYLWYEEQLKGLGSRFVDKIELQISKIELGPELYSAVRKFYRQATVPSFPFVIVYRIDERKKLIRIVSVFHTAKSPRRKFKG
jgi:plasmid stabilization system protein ParE